MIFTEFTHLTPGLQMPVCAIRVQSSILKNNEIRIQNREIDTILLKFSIKIQDVFMLFRQSLALCIL